MKNTKMNKASRYVFMRSIVKESSNDLALSSREKVMIKWFFKFQTILTILVLVWIIPSFALKSHVVEFKQLKAVATKVSTQAIEVPQAKAQAEKPLFLLLDEIPSTVYAYNSLESQTDGDPFTGAFGDITGMEGKIVANNCYLPGTIVEIEGEKYKVFDKMNSRYGCDVFDVYMGLDYEKARKWGKKSTNVKILRVNR